MSRVKCLMRLLLPVLLLLSQAVLAQGMLEVIPLRHRTADQVIPVLRPLLEPGGALSGQFNQLIVRTSPANLAMRSGSGIERVSSEERRIWVKVEEVR